MKNRKVGAGGRKKKVPSDVSPSTSLPPLVEGQLRCFLRVTISRVLWTVHKPPSSTFVRLRWWGESSDGTHFSPRDGSRLSQTSIKTTARFPIRCSPKQFTSYLTDMGCLVLEVLTKPDHLPIARAQVAGISSLNQLKPIGGFYTLVSPKSEKLGEIQVSLNLEPLVEAFDSSSSGPPTDVSIEGLQFNTLKVPSPHRPPSAGSGKESAGSSSGNTPRGRDHLFFQNAQKDKGESLENQMPTTSQTTVNPSSQEMSQGKTTNDIISVVLERGNKLRNAMVLSGLNCDVDFTPTLKDTPLPLPKDNILPPLKSFPSSSGTFLDKVFEADLITKQSDIVALVSDNGPDYPAVIEDKAVELLLGSSFSSPPPFWDGPLLSGHSSVCGDSELNDPQYDQSLLENLFYKTPISDQRVHDTGEEGQETTTMSSNKNQPEQLAQSQPGISEDPHSEPQHPADDAGFHPLLNEEQLTLLRSIRLARVTIDSLTVAAGSSAATPRRSLNKGKPPRPLIARKCTYFVEYVFPVTSASSRTVRSKAADGEVIRAVSSKVTGGVVKFDQLSVFPVHFSTATVEQWWGTDLIFKIFSRRSDQKKPVAIGKATHPLCRLLESKQLSQRAVLPVQSLEGNFESQEIGPLKVTLELGADSKSFSSERTRNKLSWSDASPSKPALSPQREKSPRSQSAGTEREDLLVHSLEPPRLNVKTPQKPSKSPSPQPILYTAPKPWQRDEEEPEVLLHALLMVPDGKDFICGPLQAPNVYLNCKLFWCDETARSVISWGQANPTFNFVQVTPVGLTAKLLERMKNNMMVIEVWQKTGSSGQDRPLGLVKLPLHQFYMSFRDPKITHLLLQAKYPVLGVDCYMPVIDVFSGSCKGNLRVVLAMGQSEQIISLQRSRDEECDSLSHLVRPVHLLDHQKQVLTKMASAQVEALAEHLFVIKVEKVSGLTPLQSTVWGEADCYVQYTFPCQDGDAAEVDHNIIETSLNLKPFRTTATLCVPNPLFGHTETHTLMAPEGVPVQRLLLSSLCSQGLSGGGGIQFEVWCRYYYPNVRDQLVARGMLPLSKLCAMVTMQRQHPDEAQKFTLPLIPRTDSHTGDHHQPSGLLNVCVRYKHRHVRSKGQLTRGAASGVATLLVQVHRASGLKAAARLMSEQDERFSHYASGGLNPFVTFQLSFLPESEMRCTRTADSTFCPEFNHQTEVSCDLLAQRSSGETCSLAEQLEQAHAVFAVWNKEKSKAFTTSKAKNVMLGSVKIPLADLIHKRTGISGWYGVYSPQEASSSQNQHILVGGLEISITFAHHSHRERALKAAQGLAWETNQKDSALQDEEESWEESRRKLSLTLSMPRVWLPVHCLLLPGLRELQRCTYCYFRYKFYEQEAFCSHMKHPCVEEGGEEGQATVSFEGSRTVALRSSLPLLWYLREEKLEVQVWVAFKKEKTRRPSDSDRLVGSAFVDLSSLAKAEKQTVTLSGVYPLFRRSAADLQGAALRVHITLAEGPEHRGVSAGTDRPEFDSQEELLSEEVEEDQTSSPKTPRKSHVKSRQTNKSFRETPDITSEQHIETSQDESFPVTVTVDRAMHLNLKSCPLAERSEGTPCCCVSYVTADSAELVSTDIVGNTECPVWDHQHDCRLSKQLLVDPQQSLVFKVWHKREMERVIGFASVDLSPLLCGFQSVCGWYNITDFTGQCHGQLKVSITPRRGVQDLRERRKTVTEEAAKNSSALFQAVPLSYQTTATYSSFPAHISRYTEQKISSPDHTERLFSERSSESDRHIEHMDNIRLFHQSLQEHSASLSADMNPSSSLLFSALRKKLGELDNIQRYFSQKLSTPTFPSNAEQDGRTRLEEHRNLQSDSSQLLLKSNQLVGEVNNIISGLRGEQLETIPSNARNGSTLSTMGGNNPQTVSSTRSASDNLPQVVSPPSSPTQERPDDPADSDPEEENQRLSSEVVLSEDGNEASSEEIEEQTNCRPDKEDGEEEEEEDFQEDEEEDFEEDEEEDFEEVVVKPRPLNEVTSLTDRTSPWTSVLSDPDLVSLESMEVLEGPDEEEQEGRRTLNDEMCDSDEGNKCSRQEESEENQSLDGSHSDSEKTLQPSHKKQDEEPNEASGEEASSSATQHITETHNAPGSSNNEDVQSAVPVEVPNFFLPSQQLEATMRAICLAPSFSRPFSDPGRGSSARRLLPRHAPPQRPDRSPTSLKREMDRIAKIFAAQFDDTQ